MPSCDQEPWGVDCPQASISVDGIQTLKLIAPKMELLADLAAAPDLQPLTELARFFAKLVIPAGAVRVLVDLTLFDLSLAFEAANKIRDKLVQLGTAAIRRDLDLHLVQLEIDNQTNTPEGSLFRRLRDAMPSE